MVFRINNAVREGQSFQNQISRLFQEGFTNQNQNREEQVAAAWAPPVDISETPDTLSFTIELPGFKNDELAMSVENGVLILEGERKFEAESNEKNYHRIERAYGKFVRSFTLPSNVNTEKIHAHLVDGVLVIALPKKEEAKPKTIPIGTSAPKQLGVRKVA